jgi:phosphoglycolate phosphatase-like HAD superfamily hydrolase
MNLDRLHGIEAIFLDDGGMMSDNDRWGTQYRVILSEYLAPRLGGSPSQWSDANTAVIAVSMDAFDEFPLDGGYLAARWIYFVKWLRDMCDLVGVEAPADEDECADLAGATHHYVWARTECEIPGVGNAIRELHGMGYRIYAGSGTEAVDLDATLRGMGVRDLFTETYGTDLVDTWKGSRIYYDRILVHAGVPPEKALFVDDNNGSIDWANEAGAIGVLIADERPDPTNAVEVLGSLVKLPRFLAAYRG